MKRYSFVLEPNNPFNKEWYTCELLDYLYINRIDMYNKNHLESEYLFVNYDTFCFLQVYLSEEGNLVSIGHNVNQKINIIKNTQFEYKLFGLTVLVNNSLKNFEYEVR